MAIYELTSKAIRPIAPTMFGDAEIREGRRMGLLGLVKVGLLAKETEMGSSSKRAYWQVQDFIAEQGGTMEWKGGGQRGGGGGTWRISLDGWVWSVRVENTRVSSNELDTLYVPKPGVGTPRTTWDYADEMIDGWEQKLLGMIREKGAPE